VVSQVSQGALACGLGLNTHSSSTSRTQVHEPHTCRLAQTLVAVATVHPSCMSTGERTPRGRNCLKLSILPPENSLRQQLQTAAHLCHCFTVQRALSAKSLIYVLLRPLFSLTWMTKAMYATMAMRPFLISLVCSSFRLPLLKPRGSKIPPG